MFAQDIVGHASDEHPRTVSGELADDSALQGEEILLRKLVGIEVAAAEEGLYGSEEGVDEAFALIVALEDPTPQSAFFSSDGEEFLVVVGNA